MRGAGDRWLAGEQVEGVAFALNDAVEITNGANDGAHGTIVLLLGLAPEPSYLVALPGGDVRVPQSALQARA
jgi:hypothetical protein